MCTLKTVKCGDTVRVIKITSVGAIKRRIMNIGVTKGVEIFVRKVAPLGNPVEVTVRSYEFSLRKADAEMIGIVNKNTGLQGILVPWLFMDDYVSFG